MCAILTQNAITCTSHIFPPWQSTIDYILVYQSFYNKKQSRTKSGDFYNRSEKLDSTKKRAVRPAIEFNLEKVRI